MKIKLDFVTNSSSASYVIFDSRKVKDRYIMKEEIVVDAMDNIEKSFHTVEEFENSYVKMKDHKHGLAWEHVDGEYRGFTEDDYNKIIEALEKGNSIHFFKEDLNSTISEFFESDEVKFDCYNGP